MNMIKYAYTVLIYCINIINIIMKVSVRNPKDNLYTHCRQATNKYCENHTDRIATHQLIPDYQQQLQQYYCQKCSIMLASQGFNVYKLPHLTTSRQLTTTKRQSYRKSCRKAQIDKFTATLNEEIQELQSQEKAALDYIQASEIYYGELMTSIQKYFREIQEILEYQKYRAYNTILNARVQAQLDVKVYAGLLSDGRYEIREMLEDIQENMDAVQNTSFQMYSAIMGGYTEKLGAISDIKKDVPDLKQFMGGIVMPEISEQIYTIYNNMFTNYLDINNNIQTAKASGNFKPQIIHTTTTNTNNNSINTCLNIPQQSHKPILNNNITKIISSVSYSQSQQQQMLYDYQQSFQQSLCQSQNKQQYSCIGNINNNALNNNNNNIKNNNKDSDRNRNKQMDNIMVIKSKRDMGFSFQDHIHNNMHNMCNVQNMHNNQRELDCIEQNSQSSDGVIICRQQCADLSQISEMVSSKEVLVSRQSLGGYLCMSGNRDAEIQETDTILIE